MTELTAPDSPGGGSGAMASARPSPVMGPGPAASAVLEGPPARWIPVPASWSRRVAGQLVDTAILSVPQLTVMHSVHSQAGRPELIDGCLAGAGLLMEPAQARRDDSIR